MKRLLLLLLLSALPAWGTTVYRTVDEFGIVSFSDTPPETDSPVETLVIDVHQPQLSETDRDRLAAMRETTDRMAADRRERERHRAALRESAARAQTPQYVPVGVPYSEPRYIGYSGSSVWHRRHRRSGFRLWLGDPPHRPGHPIARPPLHPPVYHRQLQPGRSPAYDYPASLVRRHYSPRVRQILYR